jgi:hypothetical protein
MNIKKWSHLFFIAFFISFKTVSAAQNIIVEHYKHWHHPTLTILKRYGFSVYKISYSPDGKCPTFYAKSQFDPLMASKEFSNVYIKVLKANSNYPYAIAIKDRNVKINVDQIPKKKKSYLISKKKYNFPSTCRMND